MARRIFPDDQFAYTPGAGGAANLSRAGTTVRVYTDSGATTLASIVDMSDVAITNAQLTIDSNSLLPLFKGPNDGSDTLYVRKSDGTGTITTIYARVDDRLDALAAQIVNVAVVANPGDTAQEPVISSIFNAGSGGTNGFIQIQPAGAAKHTGIQILPSSSGALPAIRSQLFLFGVIGANYERFGITHKSDEVVFDHTIDGTGTLRPVSFVIGTAPAIVFRNDAHVVIGNSKNLGIGTGHTTGDSAPAADLHIKRTAANPELRIEGPSSTGEPKISFHVGSATERAFIKYVPSDSLRFDADDAIKMYTNNTLALTLAVGGDLHMVGKPKWTAAGNEQTTVGAAGAASALPANPTKYLKIIDSAGTTLVVPAYAAT